jgi:hypothetical protein
MLQEVDPLSNPLLYYAELVGGPQDGVSFFLPVAIPRFMMALPIKDEAGRVVKRRVDNYRLEAFSPNFLYKYQGSFEVEGDRGNWMPPTATGDLPPKS